MPRNFNFLVAKKGIKPGEIVPVSLLSVKKGNTGIGVARRKVNKDYRVIKTVW